MAQSSDHWFLADKKGLRQVAERLVERRGFGIIGGELYQNVMDTSATECIISLSKQSRYHGTLIVEDNGEGFQDLSHAWTMFAPSLKKSDPTKGGRFNVGEKMVLSFCHKAEISTTTGTVVFNEDGRHNHPRRKREQGTQFLAQIALTNEWYEQFITYMRKLIVRDGLTVTVNGEAIKPRQPIHTFEVTLPTEIGDELRRTERKTIVSVYETLEGEEAMLYELGIPVVETGDKWHVSVAQKVPLNVDRDNVTPSYLRKIRVAVLNEMHRHLEEDDTTSAWVNEAASDPSCTNDAAETFRVHKYGEKSVAFDPLNQEANAEAIAAGYTVIPSRGLTPGQRDNLYRAGTLMSTSTAFPTAGRSVYSDDPNAKPVEVVPPEDWTDGMRMIREYTIQLAKRLMNKDIVVRFVKCKNFGGQNPWSACYGRGGSLFSDDSLMGEIFAGLDVGGPSRFDYNVATLGKKWFANGVGVETDSLIIHEFGHEYESNHLSKDYYGALTRLGALLKQDALRDPDWYREFHKAS